MSTSTDETSVEVVRCLTGCECDDGHGIVCRPFDHEHQNVEGIGIERGHIRVEIIYDTVPAEGNQVPHTRKKQFIL